MTIETKKHEMTEDLERLYSVVSISADMIFEYQPDEGVFRFFKTTLKASLVAQQ